MHPDTRSNPVAEAGLEPAIEPEREPAREPARELGRELGRELARESLGRELALDSGLAVPSPSMSPRPSAPRPWFKGSSSTDSPDPTDSSESSPIETATGAG